MDGGTDTLVRPASAKYISHGGIDICIPRIGVFGQQGYGTHDLTGLAIPALCDVLNYPGSLDGMGAVRGKPFDGCNRLPACGFYGYDT
jgi:hypothetical protein